MKILFITSSPLEYSSSANLRNIALIKGFSELGHEVSTLTAKPEESSSYYDSSLINFNLDKRYFINISQAHSHFTSKTEDLSSLKNKFKREVKKNFYQLYTSFSIYDPRKNLVSNVNKVKIKDTFDLIISSSDPKSSHLLAEKLIELKPGITKKWIQYWGDPFTNDINKKSLIPKR
ncbi:hypothetical protein, partial [Peribacillus frigoritolerans]|uniref:hypothetical protein n=1 Tax=Peribacillus frigoritolerans TaxID=450367 RepID=UPI001E3BEDC9